MPLRTVFRRINPFTGVAGMLVTGVMLVTAIFFTWFDLPWIAFLSGILSAAVVALLNRLTSAEEALASVRESARHLDEELPVMIAYVAADGTVRFHNQAFRFWLHARREAINGRPLRDVVGLTTYAGIRADLEAALAGRLVQRLRTHTLRSGEELRLFAQFVPHAGEGGAIAGVFLLQADVTGGEGDGQAAEAARAGTPPAATPAAASGEAGDERRVFVDTMREELTDWVLVGDRLRAALDREEFCLYGQRISAISPLAQPRSCHEILLRLREEEETYMPPGAFLPLAEEYGLLPEIDRWVVSHVLDWASRGEARGRGQYAVNVSAATIAQGGFAGHVAGELARRGQPGALLCFEIQAADALVAPAQAARLVAALAAAGCRTTLCGFGKTAASYGLLKHLAVDFLKIDGDIVLGLARNPMDLVKLKAVTRVARKTRRLTIAEFVESEETLALLRQHDVDFAQGFGIARPVPLDELG